jgi:xylan 1,4-beta-xylosidase
MVMEMSRNSRKRVVSLAAIATMAGGAPRAAAQTPATVNVTVDATSAVSPLKRIWAFHGYDEVNYTTTPPGKSLLTTLGTIDTTPPHIRTHFLLNTGNGMPTTFKWGSTNAYTADANGNAIYDWTLMDGIMDTITGAATLPFVEIGFMPHDLSIHPDPYQNSGVYTLDGGCFYPPKDYTKWGALISAWAAHSSARYSGAVPWQWELWNEPDIGYWNVTGTASKEQEYDKLFDYTESSLHRVLPTAPLGGPATAGAGAFLTQFLQHCATGTNAVSGVTGTRLDMVTFHAKGGVALVGNNVRMNLGNQLVLHRNGFNAVASFPQYKQTPIVVTEADPDGCAACPVSQNPQDAYRNSTAYGAYEVAMMKRTLELEASVGVNVRGLLTWAFLFNNQPYFAGYRTLSTNDIHLPVLNAFKLLGSLNGDRLSSVASSGALTLASILANSVRQQADVDAMATLNGLEVQVLVWNYHDDLVPAAATPVHLSVKVPAAFGPSATVTHLRVDDTHGDAYTIWTSQGMPPTPSATQLTQLRQAMEPAPLQPAQTVGVVGNAVNLDFDLPRFGISLVTLAPVGANDASTGGSSSGGFSDGAAAVDGALSSDEASSPNGSSSSGAGSSSGGGGSGMSTDGASPSPSRAGSGSGGAPSGQRPGGGCSCGVATRRPSTGIPEEVVFMLGVGLPTALVFSRRLLRKKRGAAA